MAKYDYNVIVIGAGAAGLVSAYIAAATKAKVALIEKKKMGGDCLSTGCVPSKALIRSAKMIFDARRANEFGLKSTNIEFDFKDVISRVKEIIKAIEPHDSAGRYKELGVECIEGEAKIISPNSVQVNGQVLTCRSIVVATGARPLVPPINGLDKVDYLTSDNIWDLTELPKKLVVLGGGPIGAEMAQSFARFGSDVTLVEMAPQILIREDAEVIKLITKKFRNEGINVLTHHKAKAFEKNKLVCEYEGRDIEIAFDRVIIALGRRANVTGFGLNELGIEIRPNGTIAANIFMQTNIPSIYVCGDVTGPYQFTHMAAHQAWYASINALFAPFKKCKVDYKVVPWATFTDPEIARVGLNEKDARAHNIPYEVTTYGLEDLDRAITDSDAHGFVKVLTSPGKDKILGVTIIGAHAGDLIAEYIFAMKHGLGLNKMLGTIHIYPTFSEASKYVAGNWKKSHIAGWAMSVLRRFHKLRR